MNLGWRRGILGATAATTMCLLGVVSARSQAGGQAVPQPAPQLAEQVFKDVQVLRGMPADEFLDTMGMFAAATAKDCTGCHVPEILTGSRDAFAKPTAQIQIARRMVRMVNEINKNYFGQQRVTCYTCHNGLPTPNLVPNLSVQYGTPAAENPNTMDFIPLPGVTAAQIDQVFAKYIQALGGAERLAGRTSFVAKGTYAGWDTAFGEVPLEMFAKAPGQVTTIVHRKEGQNVRTFDGRNAWFAGVDSAVPLMTLTLTGGNVAGASIEAMVALSPARIRQTYSRWQLSEDLVDDTPVQVLMGTNPGQLPVKLYFDESGLLVRLMRWRETAVGPIPIQVDYADYRDVSGTKIPFRWVTTWTNNKTTTKLSEVRPNVAIDAARFAKPQPPTSK